MGLGFSCCKVLWYHLAGKPNVLSSYPSLVYLIAGMHGIYKPNVPLNDQENVMCKIGTVGLSKVSSSS